MVSNSIKYSSFGNSLNKICLKPSVTILILLIITFYLNLEEQSIQFKCRTIRYVVQGNIIIICNDDGDFSIPFIICYNMKLFSLKITNTNLSKTIHVWVLLQLLYRYQDPSHVSRFISPSISCTEATISQMKH